MKKKLFLEKSLPMYLLGLLVVVMLLTVFIQANTYGLTTDEAMHDSYGQSVLRWYVTLGRDRGFLNYPLEDYEPEHGAIFDVVVALAQHIFHHQWQTEAIITGLTGVLGVLALALCGFELGGWWFAFLAALSLWLYPRFFGAIFNNPKDIPFTMADTFVLWSVLRLLKHWDEETSLAQTSLPVAFFLAIAIAIRANAVVWYALLGLLLVGWWLLNWQRARKEMKLLLSIKQQALIGGIIGIGSFLGTLLLWPYVFLNPLANFYNALVVIARYPWNGSVLYQGKMQLAVDLPRSYAPVWLVIGSPPALLLFAGIGLIICGGRVAVAHQSIESVAASAARAASIERTVASARAAAHDAAVSGLANEGLHCVSVDVTLNTSEFAPPIGQPGSVSATVQCRVDLSDLSVPGIPGTRLIKATVTGPVDEYRERG